jgi:hypothetical protein
LTCLLFADKMIGKGGSAMNSKSRPAHKPLLAIGSLVLLTPLLILSALTVTGRAAPP